MALPESLIAITVNLNPNAVKINLTTFRSVISKHCPDRTASLPGRIQPKRKLCHVPAQFFALERVFDRSIGVILISLSAIVVAATSFVGA